LTVEARVPYPVVGGSDLSSPESVSQGGKYILTGVASGIASFALVGSLALPIPGIYGPATLVLSVFWQINKAWKVRYLPWLAPIEYGLDYGERILLAGGSIATLIAYLWTLQ